MAKRMLKIDTISFFGHRRIENFSMIEERLFCLIRKILAEKEYVEFLVGRNGEFDQLVSSVIRTVKRGGYSEKCSHILVLPYETAEFRKNRESFYDYYDDIELFSGVEKTHFKAAIQTRNRQMVDRSNCVVFYLEHEHGVAYQTFQYAEKQKKPIIRL